MMNAAGKADGNAFGICWLKGSDPSAITSGQLGHTSVVASTDVPTTRNITEVVTHGIPLNVKTNVAFPTKAAGAIAANPVTSRVVEVIRKRRSFCTGSCVASLNTRKACTTKVEDGINASVSVCDDKITYVERVTLSDLGPAGKTGIVAVNGAHASDSIGCSVRCTHLAEAPEFCRVTVAEGLLWKGTSCPKEDKEE